MDRSHTKRRKRGCSSVEGRTGVRWVVSLFRFSGALKLHRSIHEHGQEPHPQSPLGEISADIARSALQRVAYCREREPAHHTMEGCGLVSVDFVLCRNFI